MAETAAAPTLEVPAGPVSAPVEQQQGTNSPGLVPKLATSPKTIISAYASGAATIEEQIKATVNKVPYVVIGKSDCMRSKEAAAVFKKLKVECEFFKCNEDTNGNDILAALAKEEGQTQPPYIFISGNFVHNDRFMQMAASGELERKVADVETARAILTRTATRTQRAEATNRTYSGAHTERDGQADPKAAGAGGRRGGLFACFTCSAVRA